MNYILSYCTAFILLMPTSALDDVRKSIGKINSLEQAEAFIIRLQQDSSPESKGYVASMNFIKSQYVKFPLTKMKYFKRGRKALDNIIVKNPQNIEIRYIRYLMQKQIPRFLGYDKHIGEDFKVIANGIEKDNLSNELKSIILSNMLAVENLSTLEKEKINLLLNQL